MSKIYCTFAADFQDYTLLIYRKNMDKLSYALGLGIGQQLAQMGAQEINADDFAQAIKDVLAGSELKVSHRDAQVIVQDYFQKQEQKLKAERDQQGKVHKEAGEKYLAENAKNEGVITLPSGVQYKVIKEGNGAIPTDTSVVKVNYEGRLIDGTVFDSSYKRGEPATFRANQVIKGWTEALCHMPEGSIWEVYIPQDQAYAERQQRNIDPFSTLIFKIELIEANAKRK